MFFKFFPVILLLLSIGCAERKYLTPAGTPSVVILEDVCNVRFQTSQLCVSYAWTKKPSDNSYGEMIVKVWRPNAADGSAVPQDLAGAVAVVLWMPSMGHGSSPVTVERVDVGTYRATQVFFSMPGDWEIRVQSKEGETVRDQAVIALRI